MADVTLPQLGETVTEGTITRWFKQVGEAVAADEPLFEVSTDKVDTEVPSPVAGTLTEIRANEGDTVPVGAVIAVVGDGAPTGDAEPGTEGAVAAEAAPAAPAEAPAADAPTGPAPPPAPPAPAAPPAPPVPPAEAAPPAAAAPPAEASPAEAPAAAPGDAQRDGAGDARLLSPVVRRLVNEHGLDPGEIEGTGAGGRITREDVVAHIERTGAQPVADAPAPAAPPAPPASAAPAEAPPAADAATPPPAAAPPREQRAPTASPGERDERVPLSKIRKLTGEHMVMSLATTPHAFSVVEVDYANVDTTRRAVKDEWRAAEGFGLTYLPFISRAVIDALAEFPHLNASVGDGELVVHRYVDLGIAVDLEYQGLLVPVVRDADTKRLRALAREISDLANRAKSRKLSPDEIQGGTFTISNNGSAGSVLTAAIISQPQVAILSTDSIVKKPVVVTLPDGSDTIAIHPVGNLAMSWDHRAFDGAYAAGFLVKVKQLLETRDWSAEL
jgi:pyruvate dehydrogenase E2 component (dihydrolipoamide acetyltransferase)